MVFRAEEQIHDTDEIPTHILAVNKASGNSAVL